MKTEQRFKKLIKEFTHDGKLMHVYSLLKRAAERWPKRTMVICGDDSITYGDLYKRSQLLAQELRNQGIGPGERVIIYYENSLQFYIAYFAVWQAGGIVAPLNVFLHENELIRIIKEAEPKVVIVSPSLVEKLEGHDIEPPIITEIDTTSPLPETVEPIETDEEVAQKDIEDTVAILYTSGTTGFPKGVMLTSKNIMTNTLQGISCLEVGENEKVFCPLPLFHSLPQNLCVWSITVVGATAIIVSKIDRRSLIKGISYKPTMVVAVPALYGLFCMLRNLKFPKVKYFIAGGDAMSDKIRSLFAIVYNRKIANGFGLTETSPFVSTAFADYTQPTNTIGKPFPGISYVVRDEEGKDLPQGEIGILWLAGDNIMKGYYKAPEATAEVIEDGWFNTGDLAYITKDGQIVLAGREKDLISNKGLKIYPQEVENIILSHPPVLQVGVIGVKEEGVDEIPVAFIGTKEPEENHEELIEAIRDLCKRSLAAYKVPRQFYIRRDLAVTATGKVDKKVLRAEMANT